MKKLKERGEKEDKEVRTDGRKGRMEGWGSEGMEFLLFSIILSQLLLLRLLFSKHKFTITNSSKGKPYIN